VNRHLQHRILPRGFPEPLRAQLRDPLQRVEIHIHDPEPVAEAISPLQIVLGAPQEVVVHRHAVGGRSLELPKAGPQEHDPVGGRALAVHPVH